jgi:hypothetical protein
MAGTVLMMSEVEDVGRCKCDLIGLEMSIAIKGLLRKIGSSVTLKRRKTLVPEGKPIVS